MSIRLEEALEVLIDHRGKTPRKLGSDFVSEGVPVASAILVRDGVLDLSEARYVDEETYSRWMPVPVKHGDVLLTSEAPLGRVARVRGDSPLVLGQRLFGLRGKDGVLDNGFLYYALQTDQLQSELGGRATGTTVVGIRQSALRDVRISLPEFSTQRAIGDVLGALDDKIAANTRLAATAHELAMCEFWRLETRTVKRGVLRDLTELEYGKALPAAKRIAGVVHVYGSGGKSGNHETALVAGPGVILGRKGSVGMTYWSNADFFPIDTTFYAVPRAGVPMEYIYFLLRSLEFGERNSDSAVPGLNRNDAYSARVAIPGPTELRAFEAVASTLLAVHTQALDENLALATTRDALLPQLMSGKLRVREAAEMAGV